MTKDEKAVIIDDLKEKFAANPYFLITDTAGMTVAQVNNWRRMCFDKGVQYQVVKNTLIRKALESLPTDYSSFDDKVLTGFSGVMFFPENAKVPATLIKQYRREKASKLPLLKGASVDTALFIGEENLEVLINLKSKQEMIGEILGLLQSPAKNVLSALQSGGTKLAGILKTLSEKEETN